MNYNDSGRDLWKILVKPHRAPFFDQLKQKKRKINGIITLANHGPISTGFVEIRKEWQPFMDIRSSHH
jgi:hypothetical protein